MLLICGSHSAIRTTLRAVTLTPGSREQVSLGQLGRAHVRVSAVDILSHSQLLTLVCNVADVIAAQFAGF